MPCASLPASLPFYRLSGSALTEPTISCLHFFSFRPILSRIQRRIYNFSGVSRASSPLLHPTDAVPHFRPWTLVFSMMRRSCCDIRTCGCDCWLLVSVAHLLLSSARPLLPLRKSPGFFFSLPSSLFRPRSRFRSRSRSRFRFRPIPTLVLIAVLVLPHGPARLAVLIIGSSLSSLVPRSPLYTAS